MPPSPRLSARISTVTYLNETTKLRDQTISESTPRTLSMVGARPCLGAKHSLKAYSGLVPMSP